MSVWFQITQNEWRLFDEGNFTLGRVQHFPTGWRLQWRPSKQVKFQERWWNDLELEEAKAWGLAMIRMN